jgi:hypothetical protein
MELTSDRLSLSLNFTNRLYVSSFGERDKIDFSFLGQFLFQAQTDGQMLDSGFKILGVPVPPQMASEEEFESIVSLGSKA